MTTKRSRRKGASSTPHETSSTSSSIRCKAMLKSMRQAGRFYDATIEVNGIETPIHREVLSLLSPFFTNAFGSVFFESTSRKIVIPDATPAAVTAVINYAYGLNAFPKHSPQNDFHIALDVLKLSHRYQIDGLLEMAALKVVEAVEVKDYVAAYHILQDFGLKHAVGAVYNKMAIGFAQMQQSNTICHLTRDELDQLIRSRDLVAEEAQLMQGIIMWAKYDVEERERDLENLLLNARLQKPFRPRRHKIASCLALALFLASELHM